MLLNKKFIKITIYAGNNPKDYDLHLLFKLILLWKKSI